MPTIWFYGDSFTAGTGLRFEEFTDKSSSNFIENLDLDDERYWNELWFLSKFKSWKNKYSNEVFTSLFSKKLGLDHINRGEGGASNDRILHKVFLDLQNFKPDDIIIIGITRYSRVLIPSSMKTQHMSNAGYDKINKKSFILEHSTNITEDAERAITNYCYDVLYKNEKSIENYYLSLFKQIRIGLLTKVSRVMIWDHAHRNRYEDITTWTNNKVEDGHWSPDGHNNFYKVLLDQYQSKQDLMLSKKPSI